MIDAILLPQMFVFDEILRNFLGHQSRAGQARSQATDQPDDRSRGGKNGGCHSLGWRSNGDAGAALNRVTLHAFNKPRQRIIKKIWLIVLFSKLFFKKILHLASQKPSFLTVP